jgi:hypothetical protein
LTGFTGTKVQIRHRCQGAQFTCLTGTQVQILTLKALRQEMRERIAASDRQMRAERAAADAAHTPAYATHTPSHAVKVEKLRRAQQLVLAGVERERDREGGREGERLADDTRHMSVEEGETELQRILRRLTAKHLAGKQSHLGDGAVSGVSGKEQLKVTALTEDVAGVFGASAGH